MNTWLFIIKDFPSALLEQGEVFVVQQLLWHGVFHPKESPLHTSCVTVKGYTEDLTFPIWKFLEDGNESIRSDNILYNGEAAVIINNNTPPPSEGPVALPNV